MFEGLSDKKTPRNGGEKNPDMARSFLDWRNENVEIADGANKITVKTVVSAELDPMQAESIYLDYSRKLSGTGLDLHISDLNSDGKCRLVLVVNRDKSIICWENEQIEVLFNNNLYSISALVSRNNDAFKSALAASVLKSIGVCSYMQNLRDGAVALCIIADHSLKAILTSVPRREECSLECSVQSEQLKPSPGVESFLRAASDAKSAPFASWFGEYSLELMQKQMSALKGAASDLFIQVSSQCAESFKQASVQMVEILKRGFSALRIFNAYLRFPSRRLATGAAAVLLASPISNRESEGSGPEKSPQIADSILNEALREPEKEQKMLSTELKTARLPIMPVLATALSSLATANVTQTSPVLEDRIREFAELLTSAKLGVFHCQACIDAKVASFKGRGELEAFHAKAILAINKRFAGKVDKKDLFNGLADQLILNSIIFKGETSSASQGPDDTKKSLQEGLSYSLNDLKAGAINLVKENLSPSTEKIIFNFSGGPYAVSGDRQVAVNFYGQGGVRYNLDPYLGLSKSSLEGAFSFRPDLTRRDAAPRFNPLTARFLLQPDKNREIGAGLSTSIGNPAYDLDPFADSSSVLPCGCTGVSDSLESPPARMGIFDNALWERSSFGLGARINLSENTKISSTAGFSFNDESRDNWEPQIRVRLDHSFSDNLRGSLALVQSSEQLSIDAGVVGKIGDDVTTAVAISAERGKKSSTSAHLYLKKDNLLGNKHVSGIVAGSVKKDEVQNETKWQVLGGATFKPRPKSNWDLTLGAYLSGNSAKSSEPIDKGLVGAVSFKF